MLQRLAWIAFTSLLCVAGQVCAKLGLARLGLAGTPEARDFARLVTAPLVWVGGALLVAGTLLWFQALSRIELSVALPVSCLLTLVLSLVAGRVVFQEALTLTRVIGLALALVAAALIAK